MPDLKKSRGTFFNDNRMPANENFWQYFYRYVEQNPSSPRDYVERLRSYGPRREAAFRSWIPERSNCPEITGLLEDLIERVPDQWKALTRNLFVGRVINGEVNAVSWTRHQAGIVEINLQYTFVLYGYAIAFDHFTRALRVLFDDLRPTSPDLDSIVERLNREGIAGPWSELENHREAWLDPQLLLGVSEVMRGNALPNREDLRTEIVTAAEEWIISHEIAHHLLGHTVSRRKYDDAYRIARRALVDADVCDSLSGLNKSQQDEILADTLAFILVADAVSSTATFPRLYRATLGSVLALAANAHIKETWVEIDPTGSHPGFLTRYRILAELVNLFSQNRPKGAQGDHPMDLVNQLAGFCSIPLNAWLARKFPDKHAPANIANIASHFLDGFEAISSLLPDSKAGS